MNLKFNRKIRMIAGLLASLGLVTAAQAAMPEPKNMKDVVSMSFDQRLAYTKEIDAAALKSTPQEIDEFLAKTINQMTALSPADQKYIAAKREANWKALTTEQKNKLRLQQQAFIDAMPSDVRQSFSYYASGREMR